jgi:putative nucleotidyltransferase with HDIG domain
VAQKKSETETRLETAFLNYVKKFNMKVAQHKLKRAHTLRTAELSKRIATEIGLDDENVLLAYTIGLLHDFGRFEQWERFKTFNDQKSADHGALGVKILFDDREIERFNIDKKFHSIIKFAMLNHNKHQIAEVLAPRINGFNAVTHAQVIRDADKIDIAEINIRREKGALPVVKNTLAGITPAVITDIENKTPAKHENLKTCADSLIATLSHAYNLYTAPAKVFWVKNKYAIRVFKARQGEINKCDRPAVRAIAERISNDLKMAVK